MGNSHYYVDPRWKDTEGPIIDIGCYAWDWSKQFANARPVIGIDPVEQSCPEWATLIKAVVSISDGTAALSGGNGYDNSIVYGETVASVAAVSFSGILNKYKPSVVKLNVEGAEYPLLMSVAHPVADQLIVSFHDTDWMHPPVHPSTIYPPTATSAMLLYLSQWYSAQCIYLDCKWYLFRSR